MNNSTCPVFSTPQTNSSICLISQSKHVLQPGETITIPTTPKGAGMEPFRPYSDFTILTEGDQNREQRTKILVMPSLNHIQHRNSTKVPVTVCNNSSQLASIGKGTKIAVASDNYELPSCESVCAIDKMDPIDYLCSDEMLGHLSPQERKQAREVLEKHRSIFSMSNDCVGRTNVNQFDLPTENLYPVVDPLRRVPMHKEEIVRKILKKYEALGLIEKTDSPFRASTVLVEKKNVADSADVTDRYRLCVDYRSLNAKLEGSGWPTPSLEHCLDAAADAEFLSAIDFNSGYHQIPCTQRAKEALAFSPGYGFPQYTWNVMPQGSKHAGGCFQRTMEMTYDGCEEKMLPPFYDDVTIKSKSFTEHLSNVDFILKRTKDAGFTLNALKCAFFQTELSYLGHIIGKGTVALDPKRIETIRNFPVPRNVKEVRRFIGMAQFCRRFVKNLSVILSPLYSLTKIDSPFDWSEACQAAFEEIKRLLSEAPVLTSPSDTSRFILETDASDIGIGSCLKVVKEGDEEFIVSYDSGKFSDSELKWNVVEKEAHAIITAITKNRHYLIGKKFTIRTDSRVLSYLHAKKKPKNKKLLNWALDLSEYDYDIVHIPSKLNGIADCLSRLERICVIQEVPPLFSVDELKKLQNNCEECCQAFQYLNQSKKNFNVFSKIESNSVGHDN